jgi:phosphohistidine swiveling domain-containing protein
MSAEPQARQVGQGIPTWDGEPYEGTMREVRSAADTIDLIENPVEDLVILTHSAGATSLAPLFGSIGAIVCTTGSEGCHLAILSRDFGMPCIVGVALDADDLDGRHVRLEPSGTVLVLGD